MAGLRGLGIGYGIDSLLPPEWLVYVRLCIKLLEAFPIWERTRSSPYRRNRPSTFCPHAPRASRCKKDRQAVADMAFVSGRWLGGLRWWGKRGPNFRTGLLGGINGQVTQCLTIWIVQTQLQGLAVVLINLHDFLWLSRSAHIYIQHRRRGSIAANDASTVSQCITSTQGRGDHWGMDI